MYKSIKNQQLIVLWLSLSPFENLNLFLGRKMDIYNAIAQHNSEACGLLN